MQMAPVFLCIFARPAVQKWRSRSFINFARKICAGKYIVGLFIQFGSAMVDFYRTESTAYHMGRLGHGEYPNLASSGIDNYAVSYVRIDPYTKLILYSAANYTGSSLTIDNWSGSSYKTAVLSSYTGCAKCSDFGTSTNWNDEAVSAKIISRRVLCSTNINSNLTDPFCDTVCSESGYKAPCNTIRSAYCSTGGNVINSTCQNWYNWAQASGLSTAGYDPSQYCNTSAGISSAGCREWCIAHPGQCNTSMKTYCDANPTDPACKCLKSPILGITGLIPECHDPECRNYGYKTYTPSTIGGCPDYVDCRTSLQIKDIIGNVNLTGVTIEQNCGSSGGGGVTTDVGSQAGDTAEAQDQSFLDSTAQSFGISTTMLLVIVISFVLIVILAVFLVFSDGFSLYEGGDYTVTQPDMKKRKR